MNSKSSEINCRALKKQKKTVIIVGYFDQIETNYPTHFNLQRAKMEFLLSSTRLLSCTTNPRSVNGFMECSVFNAFVQVGDFIVVAKPDGVSVVGKLIDVSNLNDICIDEIDVEHANYFFLDNSEDDNKKICGLLQIWKPVESRTIGYTALSAIDRYKLKGINELVETRNAMWFGDYTMTNLAFVFRPEEIMSGRLPALNGMQNFFLARYQELDGKYIDVGTISSFSSHFGYAYRVFSSISHIRSEIDRLMFREGSSQGDRGYIKTYLPADCWHYLVSFFKSETSSAVEVSQVQRKLCTKHSTYDLSQKKIRLVTALEIVESRSADAIKHLTKLFGNSVGVGLQKRFPMVHLPGVNFGSGDTINIISPTGERKDKISLRYDLGASKLSIVLRYSNSTYNTNFLNTHGETPQMSFIAHPEMINADSASSVSTNNDEEEEANIDEILNSQLQVGNRLYRVVNLTTENSVCIVAEDGSESSMNLQPEHANDLVDEYNT